MSTTTSPATDEELSMLRDARGSFKDWSYRDMVDLIRDLAGALESRIPNLDPRPWVTPESAWRYAVERDAGVHARFSPRPEYSQNREDYV